ARTRPARSPGLASISAEFCRGNSLQITYTDSGAVQHTVTVVALGQGGTLPKQSASANPNNPTIGIDFSGGVNAVATQLNAALGTNLQFSNSGTVLQVV